MPFGLRPDHLRFTPIRRLLSRRDLFHRISMGIGGMALAELMGPDVAAASLPERRPAQYDVLPKKPHFPAKAKRVILLFQNGGPSQVDLFDPKPELSKREGQKPGAGYVNDVDAKKTGTWMGTPFRFARHGQSGMELSELLPGLARHADDIALIRSMVSDHSNHEQAIWNFNTGLIMPGRPSLGSWVAYGLGTENQNLPAFVAILNPTGLPVDGARNYSNGWMPAVYQGLPMRAEGTPVLNLEPQGSAAAAKGRLDLLETLNREHLHRHSDQLDLEARIASFELAARMQLAATDALDLARESRQTHAMYETGDPESGIHGRQCLLARRLIERGVRFVQVLHNGQPWDTHTNNEKGNREICRKTDGPTAALLADLKQRGLLTDTLVIWAGEFGRTPMAEGKDGRDHHKFGFSLWLAGGGIKGGVTYGATDDFGYHAVENIVTVADFHATILHVLGLDHERLIFRHDTRDEKLTDVHKAKVVSSILA
ncbi:MAG TPA: DUF1501 domain-containing protein [Bryobacteraceae bacterium]|nr:DUF1501 domain-containing protein [Bryobacteraceae bacterium]